MARPWIDDDEGALRRIGHLPGPGEDTQEQVIARPFERASVHHDLVVEVENGRFALLYMFEELIAALAHDIPEQD